MSAVSPLIPIAPTSTPSAFLINTPPAFGNTRPPLAAASAAKKRGFFSARLPSSRDPSPRPSAPQAFPRAMSTRRMPEPSSRFRMMSCPPASSTTTLSGFRLRARPPRRAALTIVSAVSRFKVVIVFALFASSGSQNLAGIHQGPWIEYLLDPAHVIDLDVAFVPEEFVALRLADAVLGAETAIVPRDKIVEHRRHQRVEERCVDVDWQQRVEVQVAVADVAETDNPRSRKSGFERRAGIGDECRNAADPD